MDIARTAFGKFMASMVSRAARIVAGVALVILGYVMASPAGIVVMLVGLVPLTAGLFDFCVVSALLGGPFWGAQIRAC